MGTEAVANLSPEFTSEFEVILSARDVLRSAGQALLTVAERLGFPFYQVVQSLLHCRGHAVVSGLGKAGLVGQKISATLASTGTPSLFIHPTEALHGDLGRVQPGDIALLLSASGETEEMLRLATCLNEMGVTVIAMTCCPQSRLAQAADMLLDLGPLDEAGHLRLAPSTSTTVMLAVGDALALTVSRLRGFQAEDFAKFHPGGSLGKKLSKVDDHMRQLDQCRVASDEYTLRQVIIATRRPGRRTGAVMLVDREGTLSGIFTDSDLARLLERRDDQAFDLPIKDLMTRHPITVLAGSPIRQAIELLAEKKISELPVVDEAHRPVGILDITDVISLFPRQLCTSTIQSEEVPSPCAIGAATTVSQHRNAATEVESLGSQAPPMNRPGERNPQLRVVHPEKEET